VRGHSRDSSVGCRRANSEITVPRGVFVGPGREALYFGGRRGQLRSVSTTSLSLLFLLSACYEDGVSNDTQEDPACLVEWFGPEPECPRLIQEGNACQMNGQECPERDPYTFLCGTWGGIKYRCICLKWRGFPWDNMDNILCGGSGGTSGQGASGGSGGAVNDAGSVDAGWSDAGPVDAGRRDAGHEDASDDDAGT
jgi:hypothetical protein